MRLLHPAHGRSIFAFAAQGFDLGVLPMANVLAIGIYAMLSRRKEPHPFLWGFEVWGLGAILAYMAWCWASPRTVFILIMPLYRVWTLWKPLSPSDPSLLIVGAIALTLPELIVATLGGLITRYYALRRMAVSGGLSTT